MRFRCPDCDQMLEVNDARGPAGTCPRCGGAVTVPAGVARDTGAPAAYGARGDDWDDPRRGRVDVALRPRPVARWPRFISPSLMVLALLMLPLPWVEVSCSQGNAAQQQWRYTQTGVQMMADRHTDLNVSPPQSASPQTPRVSRQVGTILWAAVLVAGAGLGYAGRGLGCNVAHACLAAFATFLLPGVLIGVFFGEVFNSVSLTPWPMMAFLLCCGGLAGAIVTLVREWPASLRAPPRFDDEYD